MDAADHYFSEVDYLEQLLDFHSDWFDELTERDWSILDRYYGILSHPDDISSWRKSAVDSDPTLPSQARARFKSVLVAVGAGGSMPHL